MKFFAFVLCFLVLTTGCSIEDNVTGPCSQGCYFTDQDIRLFYKPDVLEDTRIRDGKREYRKVNYIGTVPPAYDGKGYSMTLQSQYFASGFISVPGEVRDYEVAIKDSWEKGVVLKNVYVAINEGPGGLATLYKLTHVVNGNRLWFRVHPADPHMQNAWIQTEPNQTGPNQGLGE